MQEIDDPIQDYANYFREQHQKTVNEYFESLVRDSQVDERQNVQTVAELRILETQHAKGSSSRFRWRALRIFSILVVIGLVVLAIAQKGIYFLSFVPAAALVFFITQKINAEISQLNNNLQELDKQVKKKSNEAWTQMAPLNALHTWDAAPRLFQSTCPQIQFDRYLTAQRLNDLQNTYGLAPEFNNGRSLFATLSGTNNQNPFVFARFKHHWMGTRTYTGSIVIHWTENQRNSQGNWVTVQRSQTLTASSVHDYPEYRVQTMLLFGHESAPDLSFSRTPSKLSGREDGAMTDWRKEHAVKKEEKQARKGVKRGDSQLTLMANREFEALFNATDRDHEVQFRLLFTALAQQEMVKLLNDRGVGYGDDFYFSKYGKLNVVEPSHLQEMRFDGDPRIFQSLELAQARKIFNEFHNEYFKALYFAFAPIWTIPLYRDKRSLPTEGINTRNQTSSNWEHEVMTNYIGEETFKHPGSVTQNILRTIATNNSDGTLDVTVYAYGYTGTPRVDIYPVLGLDGNVHNVPVHWTEFIPVERQSTVLMSSVQDNSLSSDSSETFNQWSHAIQARGIDPSRVYVRNGLAAVITA
jgi:hypothetical protein